MRLQRVPYAGYTLIELVVVMALISMLFFVAAPRFMPRLLEHRIETAARRLATAAKYLHAQTTLTRREATLHIDVAANEYWVTTPVLDDELDPADEIAGVAEGDMDLDLEHLAGSDGKVLGIEFDLDKLIEADDVEEEEMTTAFITRTVLPAGVRFAGLLMPNSDSPEDTPEFEIKYGPFGLKEAALVVLADERGRQLSIRLDPVLGESTVQEPDDRALAALGMETGGDATQW